MKKIAVVFFSTIIAILNIFPSFASAATPSVATPSAAISSNVLPAVPFSSIETIENTVNYASLQFRIVYLDMHGVQHADAVPLNLNNGRFDCDIPGNMAEFICYQLYFFPGALPPVGKYRLQIDFASEFSVGYDGFYIESRKAYSNASTDWTVIPVTATDFSGDFYIDTTVDINSNLEDFFLSFVPDVTNQSFAGWFKVRFDRLSSSTDTAVDTAGTDSENPTQDTAQNTSQIADNTAQIVDNQAEIMDTIREQVQYITLQLEAFWNQLAGQFTNLFNKMNDQLSQLLNGIEDQTTEVTGAIDDVEAEINQSTTEINQNIDQSTNQITNGYDNSSLNNSANEYHQADQELENAQNAAWDQGAGRIEDFDFGEFDFSPGVMAALSYCGNWLQNVFVGISFFNLPITIGLTIVFALMIIGYYRYH